MIIDYDFYSNNYRGNLIPQEEFDKYAMKASNEVRLRILNRAYSKYEELVMTSTCEVAEILYNQDLMKRKLINVVNGSEQIITSERVGDYQRNMSSVTSNELKEMINNVPKQITDVLETNLMLTGLLYRGM